jgi:hypothetical protein
MTLRHVHVQARDIQNFFFAPGPIKPEEHHRGGTMDSNMMCIVCSSSNSVMSVPIVDCLSESMVLFSRLLELGVESVPLCHEHRNVSNEEEPSFVEGSAEQPLPFRKRERVPEHQEEQAQSQTKMARMSSMVNSANEPCYLCKDMNNRHYQIVREADGTFVLQGSSGDLVATPGMPQNTFVFSFRVVCDIFCQRLHCCNCVVHESSIVYLFAASVSSVRVIVELGRNFK